MVASRSIVGGRGDEQEPCKTDSAVGQTTQYSRHLVGASPTAKVRIGVVVMVESLFDDFDTVPTGRMQPQLPVQFAPKRSNQPACDTVLLLPPLTQQYRNWKQVVGHIILD